MKTVFQLLQNSNSVALLACLHDQNKSDFFGGPALTQPINLKSFQKGLIGWKKVSPPKKPLLF